MIERLSLKFKTVINNAEAIKNDPFGGKIFAKLSKNYNLQEETFSNSNPSLSPILSDNNSSHNKPNNTRNEAKMRVNSDTNKYATRRQHMNRNGEKRNNYLEGNNKVRRISHSNQQNNVQKGPYRNISSPGMYPQMGTEMMPQNFGPNVMQPNFFMPQPQMYNQYFNYSSPQQGMFYPKIY